MYELEPIEEKIILLLLLECDKLERDPTEWELYLWTKRN